jgi:hypothetical protein
MFKGPMRKPIVILSAGLAAVGLAFAPACSSSRSLPLAKLPVRKVMAEARPLVWLDEQFLLAGVDHKIVKLDSRDATIAGVVTEPYHPGVGHECFSREGGRFPVREPETSSGGTSYANMRYHFIKNWNEPEDFEEQAVCEGWNTNPHDCTFVEYERASGDRQEAEQLMKAAHGRTMVYTRPTGTDGKREWSVTLEKNGPATEVTLGQPPFFYGVGMRSTFDESSGRYFWYLSTENFNLANPHWPLKGWRVTPEGDVKGMVILPNGPWIKPFTTLYELRFFSCGPSCYSHMQMWAGREQLYVGVWGKAIDSQVRGVYRLGPGGQAWEKVIAGTLDNGLVLSPNGCQLAYSTRGAMHVMTVCDGA